MAYGGVDNTTYYTSTQVSSLGGGGGCVTVTPTVPVLTATRTATPGAATATPTCGAGGGPVVFTGTLGAGDPTMPNRLFRDGIQAQCPTSKPYPGPFAVSNYYDTYSVTNTSNSSVCVRVDLTAAACNAQLSEYLTTFDPNNLATNYLGDPGLSTGAGGTVTNSVTLPAGAVMIIVVNDPNGTLGCGPYTVTVTGLPGGACGTSTATPPPVNTSTPTRTSTPTNTPTGPALTPTRTNTPTNTPITPGPTNTSPPPPTNTLTVGPTSTVCPITFSDVPPGSTFYTWIRCLACRGIINGYPDGTFRPNNNVTRGQLSKIVSNSAGFSEPVTGQMFEDVPPGSTFYVYIGRLAGRGFINGYPCNTVPSEPCIPPGNLPYFRPNANASRGQISKIVSNAAGFTEPHTGQTFQDVAPGSTFYDFIERLASRGVMSGYPCNSVPGEPCVPPENRPYFRPNNNATRGQTSKIVANTFFPGCDTPSR
jgi:hypothetical protein